MHISTVTEEQFAAYLATLPVDDEPLSDEEIAAIERGRAAAARGELATAEEVARIVDGDERAAEIAV